VFLLERDEAHEEKREPHAGGSVDDGYIMTFGTDARGAVDYSDLVWKTKEERDEEKHSG